MKRKLLEKTLIFGIIIVILSSISGHSVNVNSNIDTRMNLELTFEEDLFDLEIVSIKKLIYTPDVSHGSSYETEMEIVIKNNGPSNFNGKFEFIYTKVRQGLGIPRFRTSKSFHTIIHPGKSTSYRVFSKTESMFFWYFPGIYKICYEINPFDYIGEDTDLSNNKQCIYFLLFFRYYYPDHNWLERY